MADRITSKRLDALCANINREFGQGVEPYVRQEDGTLKAVPGTFVVDGGSMGTVALCRMSNEGGGLGRVVAGYGTKRECYDEMQSFLEGARVMRAHLKAD